MNKDKMRVMADRVFRDMAGGMAAGLAYVGTETGPCFAPCRGAVP
jgi:hypothetical protein